MFIFQKSFVITTSAISLGMAAWVLSGSVKVFILVAAGVEFGLLAMQ